MAFGKYIRKDLIELGTYRRYDSQGRRIQDKKETNSAAKKIVLVFLLIICILFNLVYVIYNSFMSQINFVDTPKNVTYTDYYDDTDEVSDSDAADNVPDDIIVSTEDVTLYLLVGADSRFGIDDQSRSDSMIIMAVDRKHQTIKLISIMRDLLLKVPGRNYDRINSAYSTDSGKNDTALTCTRTTIKNNFGIDLEKFVIIDFSGFKKIIDMMGGVTMELTKAEANYMCSDPTYGNFPRFSAGAGTYTLSGAEALNYARMRKVGNDFARTERQRKMIAVMIEKMREQSYWDMAKMIKEALGYVSTNIQEGEILGLAFDAPTLVNYEVVQYRLPIDGSFDDYTIEKYGTQMRVLWANYKWTATQLQKFIFEDDMTYANTEKYASVKVPAMPSSVTVIKKNS